MNQYFSHDYNSRNDPKMVKAIMLFEKKYPNKGMLAVGIYWSLVEILYEQGGYINFEDTDSVAYSIKADISDMMLLINETQLFNKDITRFWSDTALMRLAKMEGKSKKASESANARWAEHEAKTKFVAPTQKEVEEEMIAQGIPKTKAKLEAEKFIAHYEQSDWKMKNRLKMQYWKKAVTTWKGNYASFGGELVIASSDKTTARQQKAIKNLKEYARRYKETKSISSYFIASLDVMYLIPGHQLFIGQESKKIEKFIHEHIQKNYEQILK